MKVKWSNLLEEGKGMVAMGFFAGLAVVAFAMPLIALVWMIEKHD